MSITPNEILEKEFEARFRGYDKEEVRAFWRRWQTTWLQ